MPTMTTTSHTHAAYRPWSVRTVVVRLSRKLSATYRIRSGRRLSQLLATLLAAVSPWATALPEGAQVVAGQASVSTPSANAMVVNQASDKAVLNWQSFNIGVGQSMQFVQPGAASVALNRVIGNGASSIFGSLSANGQVFLVNPSGVMFAPGAQVNVGGLVASSLDISNGDFMAGRYNFSGSGTGAVSNHGSITAARGGYVLLAAPQVTNTGAISAEAGSVGLLAGSRVSVDTSGVGLVSFSVDAAAAQAAIDNSGSITAAGGQVAVLASAMGDAMATVINQSGVIRANSAVERNGTIVLSGGATGIVNVSGELSAAGTAAGQTGGTVKVLGDKVALSGGALIDVSGDAGGGTALVGGDYQGLNAGVQNANRSYMGADASIKADALSSGNGGKVIVWADDVTQFNGSITAKGGAQGGDGGFVETSGKATLQALGSVDASAPNGAAGQWLLDPNNITIRTAGPDTNVSATPNFTSTNDSAIVTVGSIVTALNGGTSVNVTTASLGTNGQVGDITVANAIAKTAGGAATLTLNAANNIAFSAGANVTSTTGALGVTLNAAGTITSPANFSLNGGTLNYNAAGNVTQSGLVQGTTVVVKNGAGALTLSGANTYSGGTTVKAGTLSGTTSATAFGTGAITLGDSSGSANTTLNGGFAGTHTNAINVAAGNTGVASITSSANSIFSGAVTLNNHDLLLAPAANTLTLSGAVAGTGNLALNTTGAGTITLSGAGTLNNTGTVTNSGTGAGGSTISKVIGTNVMGVVQNSATSQLTLSGANTYSGGTTIKAGTASGTVAAAFGTGAITLGDTSGSANATLSGGAAHTNAINVAAGNTGLAAITSSAASTFSGAVTLNNHDLKLTRTGANLTLSGGVTGTGNLSLNNNSTTVSGLTLSGAAVNNAGTITNSGTGTGAALVSAAVGSNVTAVTENSSSSALNVTGALTVNGAGTTLTNSNASGTAVLTVSGGVNGTGNLVLNNNGVANGVTLATGTVNNTGTITNSGTGTGTALVSAAVGSNVTAITENSATSALTVSGALTVNGAGTTLTNSNASGTSVLAVTGAVGGTGNLVLNNNSAIANGITLSGAAILNNTGTVSNTGIGTGTTAISKVISTGVTGVVQNSATSQLTLSGANTYASGTVIKAGTTSGTVAAAFGTGAITLGDSAGSANAMLNGGGAVTHSNAVNVAAGNTGIASITSSANSVFSGAVTLNNHDLQLASAASTLTLSGGVTGTGNLALSTTGAGTITLSGASAVNNSGTISNTGTGAGATTISAAVGSNVTAITENSATSTLTVSGALTVNGAGTTLTNSNASGTSVLAVTGAVGGTGNLVLNNNSAIANGITLSGAAILNNTGTVSNTGIGTGTTAISKVISTGVTGVVQNSATSQLTLSGANTYASGTVIKAGTTSGTVAAAFGTGAITLGDSAGSANAMLNGGGAVTHSNAVNVAAGNTGIASITSSANSVFSGAVTLNNHDLQLASAASTLTLSGGVTGTGNLALSTTGAGTITLSGASAVNNSGTISNTGTGAGATTISAAVGSNVTAITENSATSTLTVSGALTVNGAGTTLTNSNASGTSVLAVTGAVGGTGNLMLNNNSAIANGITLSGAAILNNTGTVSNTGIGTGTTAISKVIGTNVTGVVQNSASSQLTLSGINTYSSGTTIKAGTVSGTVAAAFGTGAITLGDSSGSANATLNGGGAVTHTNAINVAAGNTGIASITSSANSIFNGAVTLNNHDLMLAPAASPLTLTGAITGTGNLNTAGGGTVNLSGAGTLNNIGTVTNSGTGTGGTIINKVIGTNVTGVVQNSATSQLTLNGANTYSGGTTIKAGTVSGLVAAAFGTGVITLGDSSGSANATLNGGGAVTHANTINVAAGNTGVASITSSANSTFSGAVTLNNHDLMLAPAASTLTLTGAVTGTGNLALNTTGAGAITLSGAGTLNNTGTVTNSGTGTGGSTISKVIGTNVTGVVQNSGTSQLTLSGANTYSGGTAIKAGTVSGTVAAAFSTGAITLGDISGSANTTLSGGAAHTNAINVASGNTGVASITSSAASTFSGAVTLNNHALRLAPVGSNLTLSGGITGTGNLALNSTGTGAVTLSTAGVNNVGTISNTGTGTGATAISAVIGSNVTGVVQNSATSQLTLSGANTYSGGTTIKAGTVSGTVAAAFGTGAITLGDISGSANTTLSGGAAHTNAVNVAVGNTGVASITASAASTFSGAVTLNNHDLRLAPVAGNLTLSGAVAGAGNLALNTTGAGTITLSGAGALNNVGTVTNSGTGTGGSTISKGIGIGVTGVVQNSATSQLTLSGVNTYTGATAVNVGTLRLGVANAIGAASAVNVLSGATLDLNSFSDTVASVSSAGLVAFGTGNTLTTSGAQTYTGQVTGNNVKLASNGGGAITASNTSNNFAGNLTILTAGAASVVNAGALALGQVSADSLSVRALGGNLTLNSIISTSGSGDAIVLTTSGNFINNTGAGALVTPSGRWLVYSTSPVSDVKGGLTAAFKQYNATYGSALLGTGNGFVHSVAPTISAGLTGTVSKVYDGTASATLVAGNFTSSGAIDGDVIALNNPAAGSYDNKNAGTGKTVSVSGVTATASNGATTVYGYQVSGGGTLTGNLGAVTARSLTVSATGTNKVYDGNTTAGVTLADNRVAGDVLTTSNTAASFIDKNAGTGKTVNVSGIAITGTDAGNYSVNTTAATTANITQRALTVSATGTNKVYDGNTTAGVTLADNRVAGDVLTASNTAASFGDKNVGTGKAVSVSGIGITGTDAGNYSVNTTAATTADITQRALTVSATGTNKVYDGNTTAGVTLADNRVAGDVLTATNTAASFGDKNAGTGKTVNVSGIAITGTDAGNYSVNTTAATTADITQRALTVSATGSNKVYDGNMAAGVTLADNRVAGDVLTASNTAASFGDKNVGSGKAVSVSGIGITGTDAGNYSVNTTAATTADITQRALTVSATGQNRVYDGGTIATVTLLDNRVAGDVLTASNTAASFGDKNVGTGKAVSVSGIGITGTDAGNYTVNSTAATTANITQRALTVSATGSNKVYDGGTTAGVTLADNRVAGDVLTASNTAANFADKNVGTSKAVSVSGIGITGADAGNYSANTTAATTANITQRALTVGATGSNKVYDGGTAAGVTLADNRVAGDMLTASNTAANFADKNVGTGKAVSVSGIGITGTDAGNYSVNTTAATTADITQRALTVSATGQNRGYDGGTVATVTLSDNRVAGDVLSASNTAASFLDKNVGIGKTVNVSGIGISGTDAGNYSANTTAATTADITQRALTVSATGSNKVYDGGTTAGVTLADNRVAGDTLTASNTAANFADKNVGTGKAVSVGGIAITGTDAGNYSVNTTAATTANITQRALTVNATGSNKVYDGGTAAGVTLTDNRVAGDVLSASNTAASFADKNVGTGKAVSVAGIAITGTDAGNYSVNTTAATTADITQRALTVGAAAQNKVYDGGTTAVVTLSDNRVAGDVLSASNTSAAFTDKNAGIGKTVNVGGIAITGTDAGNYSVNATAATTANITPASIANVSGITAADKVQDATTAATLATGGAAFTGRIGADVLTVGAATGNFDTPAVGSGKPVSITGITLSGADAGNYVLLNTTAATTANITPAPANMAERTGDLRIINGTALPVLEADDRREQAFRRAAGIRSTQELADTAEAPPFRLAGFPETPNAANPAQGDCTVGAGIVNCLAGVPQAGQGQ
jgi:filamentous hemagglutinin family protein